MAKPNSLVIALKALCQLGLQQVGLYALYKFGLVTGHYRRIENREQRIEIGELRHLFTFPIRDELLAVLGKDGKTALLAEADEIVGGKVRLFGAEPVELALTLPGKLEHWTKYETGKVLFTIHHSPFTDIKFLWEPARFGWAFTLGRAFHLTGDEKYAETFWRNFETFTDANPPCLGPHWMSGQEAALRLMAFVWAGQVFDDASASTPERKRRLADSVAAHAARIPPTLVYARSQHNNHLLTEAAGLLTAGLALTGHPDAARWSALGWRWLNHGLQSQIDSYGEYAQHSTNYHRLMLQVVLWTNAMIRSDDLSRYRWPHRTREAVERSVHWLLSLMDSESGRTPNLGANDGAYIFPLTVCPFADYRPVLHAAARLFLDYDLPRGPWDEMALWFATQDQGPKTLALPRYLGDQLYGKQSWAYFRTAQFTSRPSHADQLHLDLWWRGLNVAQDAGTYLYNTPAPWNNSLTAASVHNTVTVDGRDQFTRAGRFLYLDWFDAYRKSAIQENPHALQEIAGQYHAFGWDGIRHTRTVTVYDNERWHVVDSLLSHRFVLPKIGRRPLRFWFAKRTTINDILRKAQDTPQVFRIHWLLPDWKWKIIKTGVIEDAVGYDLKLLSPHGWITVRLVANFAYVEMSGGRFKFGLVRAGETVYGNVEPLPGEGWVSPTYGVKVPALSLSMTLADEVQVHFVTEFIFPKPGKNNSGDAP